MLGVPGALAVPLCAGAFAIRDGVFPRLTTPQARALCCVVIALAGALVLPEAWHGAAFGVLFFPGVAWAPWHGEAQRMGRSRRQRQVIRAWLRAKKWKRLSAAAARGCSAKSVLPARCRQHIDL